MIPDFSRNYFPRKFCRKKFCSESSFAKVLVKDYLLFCIPSDKINFFLVFIFFLELEFEMEFFKATHLLLVLFMLLESIPKSEGYLLSNNDELIMRLLIEDYPELPDRANKDSINFKQW